MRRPSSVNVLFTYLSNLSVLLIGYSFDNRPSTNPFENYYFQVDQTFYYMVSFLKLELRNPVPNFHYCFCAIDPSGLYVPPYHKIMGLRNRLLSYSVNYVL